jgi:H+/Cl- antiporter ClcA
MKTFLVIFVIVILLFITVDAGAAALREYSQALQQVRQAELQSCVDIMQIYANMEALRINSQLSQSYMQQSREQQSELLLLFSVILVMIVAMVAGFFFFLWYTKK